MRPIALLGLTLTLTLPLAGCGDTWWNPPFTGGYEPHRPVGDSDNLRRVMGLDTPTAALQNEPGNVWPGPLPPSPTLSDVEMDGRGAALPPPIEPRPAPAPAPAARPRVSAPPTTTAGPPNGAPVVVPNGNGTSTVIHPDGRIETIPATK